MNKKFIKIMSLSVLVLSSAMLSITAVDAGLYRWVDANGKIHFSDKIPPAIAQKGHSELGLNGIEKKKVLSAEELKQVQIEKQKYAQQKQLLAMNIEKQRVQQYEKAKHDQYLLLTYDSKDELINNYQNKFSMLTGTANILVTRNEELEGKIKKLEKKQAATKNAGLKKSLKIDITHVQNSINQYLKALDENQLEMARLKKQYADDLKRYTELTSQ